MRWHRLAAIARKETIQILRDWRSLVLVAAMPLVLTLLFGYALTIDIKHIPFYAFDREGSQRSQDLLKRFAASEYFAMAGTVDSYRALTDAIDRGRCKFGLVIPHDFSHQLRSGHPVAVQALIEATDDNTANMIVGYSETVIDGYSQEVQLQWLGRYGRTQFEPPLSVDYRTWFNEDLESTAFVVPGVIAVVMAVIGTFLTSLTIAREWERGTMEQLISTPVTRLEVILGKLAPYFVIGMIATALCTAVAVLWFEVPFRGDLATLFAASALFLSVVLALGFWISSYTRSQLVASQISTVATYMPSLMLSGLFFAIDQMPAPIQLVTYIVAARYYNTALKGVFLKGLGAAALAPQFAALALLAAGFGAIAVATFRKRIE
ncbi:MAG: ABC transporter permease [Candidatus Binataceae bacterium]